MASANSTLNSPATSIVITETAAGALKITTPESWWLAEELDGSIYGTKIHTQGNYFDIVLPAGVTFSSIPKVEVTAGDLELGDISVLDDNTLRIEIDAESNVASTITIYDLSYSCLNQPFEGNVAANVGAEYNMASNNPLENVTVGRIGNPITSFVIGTSSYRVNGVDMPSVAAPYIKNNRTYLAILDLAAGLGIDPLNVLWDEANQRITLIKVNKTVQLTIGSPVMYVNGAAITMDAAPEMGPTYRAMLPAAFVAQAFGAVASWDESTNTITIK